MPDTKNRSIDIKVQACLRGPAISIYEMSVDASSASIPKAFNMQIQFEEKNRKSLALLVVLLLSSSRPHWPSFQLLFKEIIRGLRKVQRLSSATMSSNHILKDCAKYRLSATSIDIGSVRQPVS